MSAGYFSPELRLLFTLVRAALGTAAAPTAPATEINWGGFLALVERHRLGGFLQQRAAAALSAVCPPATVEGIAALARANARRALACAAEQVRLVRALDEAGIAVLALKGLVLGEQLHGNLHTRHVGDIDLALRPADAERADGLMQAAGWRRTNPDFPLTPLQTRKFIELKPEFEYVRDQPPLRIELRWRLEGATEFDALLRQADVCALGGQALRTLPTDFNLVYLLQHGARHGWFRLFWLVDIALLLRTTQFDATAVLARARALEAERAVWQGLQLVEELLGVPCPAPLRPPPSETRRAARLAATARTIVREDEQAQHTLRGWSSQLLYRVRLQSRLRGKFSVLTPHLYSPLSWRMWRLPDRWFFLYNFAAPFLWLWRRARR